jgi:hypothetical protein
MDEQNQQTDSSNSVEESTKQQEFIPVVQPESHERNEPLHHKHAKLSISLFLVGLFLIIGLISFYLTNNTSEDSSEMPSNSQDDTRIEDTSDTNLSARLNVPGGFVLYTGDGFSFYYPAIWGDVSASSVLNEPIFAAEFTQKNNARLFLNTGNQDFSSGGRGGAYWDCVGYTEIGSKDVACKAVYIEDNLKRLSGGALVDFEYVAHQINTEKVVLHQYEFFEESVMELLFNPSSSMYYGGSLLLINPTGGDLEIMRQIGSLFTTTPEGI